ncbi:MAG: hypothetical protein QW409_00785 [Candidatus Aenigmatarchaeota archaeon]
MTELNQLYRELELLKKSLFEERNLQKVLEIGKSIKVAYILYDITLTHVRGELIKTLLGVKIPYEKIPTSSITNIINVIWYLYNELGLERKKIGKIVKKLPQLLGLSVEYISGRVEYLRGLGIKNVGKVVEKFPSTIELSVEYMDEKVNYLKKIGIKNVGKVVEKFPQVLSVGDIDSKIKYLQKIGFDLNEIVRYIENNPSIVAYSLSRLIARIEYAISKGYRIKSLSTVFSLTYPSDKGFVEKLKRLGYTASLEEYIEFKESEKLENIVREFSYSKNLR